MVCLATIALATSSLLAQEDYFLGNRHGLIQVLGGWSKPDTNSEIYAFSEDVLTLDPSDLDGPVFQVNFLYQVNDFFAVGGGFTHFRQTAFSEDRHYVYEDGSPIEQETGLESHFFGALLHLTPFKAGRRVGNKAWLPGTAVPYLVLGAGFKTWDFHQRGEFVDSETLEVFRDYFSDEGVAPALRLGGGLRLNISKHLDVDLSAMHDIAEDELSGDFSGFGDLDLAATHFMVGLLMRF